MKQFPWWFSVGRFEKNHISVPKWPWPQSACGSSMSNATDSISLMWTQYLQDSVAWSQAAGIPGALDSLPFWQGWTGGVGWVWSFCDIFSRILLFNDQSKSVWLPNMMEINTGYKLIYNEQFGLLSVRNFCHILEIDHLKTCIIFPALIIWIWYTEAWTN